MSFRYFPSLEKLSENYFYVKDMQIRFRDKDSEKRFYLFVKSGDLFKEYDVGVCSEFFIYRPTLWLFIGANDENKIEIAGRGVLKSIESYPEGGRFRSYLYEKYILKKNGKNDFHEFITGEHNAGKLANIELNLTAARIKY
ncbi:MAG: hypothetical protein V1888_02505 [archaeon]